MKIDQKVSQKNTSEIDFRIDFKREYGIDYLAAIKKVNQMKSNTERKWNDLLVRLRLK